jgi:aryl-alcohol dehydrogenase
MAARIAGATTIVAVDRVPVRLTIARSVGATATVNLADTDHVASAIREAAGGGLDYSIECAGNRAAFTAAVDVLRNLGECAIVGGVAPGTSACFDWRQAQAKGIRVRGVVEGDAISSEFIPVLTELLRGGQLPLERLVRYYDFDEINQAVEAAESGDVIKPILRMPAAV